MSNVRKFRWETTTKNPEGYGPNDGFDFHPETLKVVPVKNGEVFGDDESHLLMLLLGLLPDIELLEKWAADPKDDFVEVTA